MPMVPVNIYPVNQLVMVKHLLEGDIILTGQGVGIVEKAEFEQLGRAKMIHVYCKFHDSGPAGLESKERVQVYSADHVLTRVNLVAV